MSDHNETRGTMSDQHHHARFIEGCHWCELERNDTQPPVDDTPWRYGPREEIRVDESGALRFARPITPQRLAELIGNPFDAGTADNE